MPRSVFLSSRRQNSDIMVPMQELSLRTPTPRHVPITVEIYHLMAERGAFHPDDRVELIGGKIFDMSPIGRLHARCVNYLNAILTRTFGSELIVSTQNPILLDDLSEPQPDICLLRPSENFYKDELPKASDVMLAIEVADSSVEFDRSVKLRRYAMAAIPESWLVDLGKERIEVHTLPGADGYGNVDTLSRGDVVRSKVIPSLIIEVDDILG